MTVRNVTSHIEVILFSEYGWPDTLVSGNGPCYNVTGFKQIMEGVGVHHITNLPHYHQPNEQAEKYNLSKARKTGKNPYSALPFYRNTPLCNDLQSPIELLCARKARSDLSMSHAAWMQV